ncbi:hypothetical protein JOB18_017903 [Solea senegalensis]|uniref:Secreted protein n=1 Tax=Solea senegalensis TaxID=28829 RepID=A0AAV6RLD3_SOLSE|nr:hypothetical protein JOB18_017903 [Solea senegalensis]
MAAGLLLTSARLCPFLFGEAAVRGNRGPRGPTTSAEKGETTSAAAAAAAATQHFMDVIMIVYKSVKLGTRTAFISCNLFNSQGRVII